MIPDDATLRQITAARPDKSTWLSANAGSGKTRVLTDRVARLLLDGVEPQHILCLTYTKAAASEMQNRLFKRLGAWAMRPDESLAKDLRELGIATDITAQTLRDARRLFARAIETPGGLKIQTIHSFCSSLLRRFPLEAGVTPLFTEMDDRSAAHLRADIVEAMADGPHARIVSDVAMNLTDQDFGGLTQEVVSNAGLFKNGCDEKLLSQALQIPEGLTLQGIADQVFLGGELDLLSELIKALEVGKASDQKAAASLRCIAAMDADALPILESVFLYGDKAKSGPFSAKIGAFPTKECREGVEDLMPRIEDLMRRVEGARDLRLAVLARDKTISLQRFAEHFLPAYESEKQLRGWLDFDDLILRAKSLLTDPKVAAWVLFRLDGGIDHILVDEAQDTSPTQWQVIERLAQEFTSGQGARPEAQRTIFVVGDKKQSIYSFQGADPRAFDQMQAIFGSRLADLGDPLQLMGMEYSFRSSLAILSLVDEAFKTTEKSGFTPEQGHKAFHHEMPGRVDLWPVIETENKPEEAEWYDPVDIAAPSDPSVILARQIATQIKTLIDSKHPLPATQDSSGTFCARPVQPGDILILVQRRSDLFEEIIRECKAAQLPIAGADRLKVGAEMAVKDLAAILSFLATPDDNLSLATALRSPLFGWTESELYDLANGRPTPSLWHALRHLGDAYPNTMAMLNDLRSKTDFLRPYDLIERVLTYHDGRRKLLARLGQEAEDGIDALLTQALTYERTNVPSLTGFLVWMETDDLEIKRQMDSAGNRIRVMTVHGAKGLEAPIVILPDTGKRTVQIKDRIIELDGLPIWKVPSKDTPKLLAKALEQMKEAQIAERDRLLYVAMTRAEKWLIVAAAGELGTDGASWYDTVLTAMRSKGAVDHDFGFGVGLRLSHGTWPEAAVQQKQDGEAAPPPLPDFYSRHAPTHQRRGSKSPSDLGGAKALPSEHGLDEEAAKRRGRQVHALLEHLPEVSSVMWPNLAETLLSKGPDGAQAHEVGLLLAEARKVLEKPGLSHLFDANALREVSVTATVAELDNTRIHGVIDCLIPGPDHVLIVDFKTNAMVPDDASQVPDGVLRQMGAYLRAVEQIYPDRQIDCAILWTRTATLMPLPHDLVIRALCDTQIT